MSERETDTAASQRSGETGNVEIIDFEPRYASDFKRLNVEWLEKYFTVEPIDELVLSDPSGSIIEPGGAILLARAGDEIVPRANSLLESRSPLASYHRADLRFIPLYSRTPRSICLPCSW